MLIKNKLASSTWLQALLILQVLTGRYFRLSQSKYICCLIKLYCVLLCVATNSSFIFYKRFSLKLASFVTFQYMSNVMINLIDSENDFFTYCSNVRTIDRIIGFKKIPLFSNYIYKLVFFVVLWRLVLFITRFTIISIRLSDVTNMFIQLLAVDLTFLYISLIFSIVHCRMRFLRFHVENICVPVNVIGYSGVGSSVEKIRKSLYYYNNLLDSMQYINNHLQHLCAINIIATLPKLLFVVHKTASSCYKGVFPFASVLFVFESVITLFCLTLPAVIVEAIQYEVKKIRESLTKQLVGCSDGSLKFELETALHYVRLRPFSYSIYRVMPLSISLPTSIICLCITYEIVVMQLTHIAY